MPSAPAAKAVDYTGAGDADMFAKSDRKKYLPLAVIGVVLLIGIIILSAGGSSEPLPPEVKQGAKPVEKAKGPPRDIRAQMADRKDKAAGEEPGSSSSPAAKDPAEKADDSSGSVSGSSDDDLVKAMKQGLEKD